MAPESVHAAALLVTGTVGSGKTTVAQAIGELLADRGVPHALIDLDQLRRSWPVPAHDRFNHELEVKNLRSVAANYLAAGAQRLVLAGVVEQQSAVQAYQRAVDCTLHVVRLRADPNTLADRLHDRHQHDPDGLSWHLARAPELDKILDQAGITDVEVDTTGRPVAAVAVDVLSAARW